MLACNRIDEKLLFSADQALPLQEKIALGGFKHRDTLNLMEAALLPGQLHDLSRIGNHRKTHTHEGLVSDSLSGLSGNDRLEIIPYQFFPDELLELLPFLGGSGLFPVNFGIKLGQLAFLGSFHLIHREVRVFFHNREFPAVLRIPGDTSGNAQVQLSATRKGQRSLLHRRLQIPNLLPDGLLAVIAIKQHVKLIAGNPGTERTRRRIPGQTLSCSPDILIAPVVAEGIVHMLQIVRIHHDEGCVF